MRRSLSGYDKPHPKTSVSRPSESMVLSLKMQARINKYLASAGYGSRRECESLVTAGRVEVNGAIVRELHTRVGDDDLVRVDGKAVRPAAHLLYYVLHKPAGYVTSRRGGKNERTIYDLLPANLQALKYAGRLDKESRGLLILSNDGDFLNDVSHPSRAGKLLKRYRITVEVPERLPPESELRDRFLRGIAEGGELLRAREVVVADRERGVIEVALGEGRNRQLRRMFRALNLRIRDLYRYAVGPLHLERNCRADEGRVVEFDPEPLRRDSA